MLASTTNGRFPGDSMRERIALLLGALLAVSLLCAPNAVALQAPPPPPQRAELQAALRDMVEAGAPGAVGAVSDERGEWRGAAGVREIPGDQTPKPDGQVRVASISKTFTATVILQLAGEGRLNLDEPVSRTLPGLLPYPEPITARQLLRHTSGLPRDLAPEDTWATLPEIDTERAVHFEPDEVVKLATSKQPLQFEPGTGWGYSNVGYTVLAMLAERVTAQPLERLVAERITEPLGLRSTKLVRDYPYLPGAAMRGYEQLYPLVGLTDVTKMDYSRYFGAGTILSNAVEVNRFFDALLGGRLLAPEQLRQMKDTIPVKDQNGNETGLDYGLGLMRIQLDKLCPGAGTVYGHGGNEPGYSSFSMHTEHGERDFTNTMSRSNTMPPDGLAKQQQRTLTEFCGKTPGNQAKTPSITMHRIG